MTTGADLGSSLFGGRYAIGGVIGVGASASVYEAEDVSPQPGRSRRVAVKILHPHLADRPEVRAAFLEEASRAESLRHQNIVVVRGCGLHDAGGVTLAWIALDLVEGTSLADLVARQGRLTVGEAATVMDGTLAALGAAHALGIVHRDVTPRNIMLTRKDADEAISAVQVRVLDFGLSDVAGGTTVGGDVLLTGGQDAGTTVVGSAAYMSPEQAQGRPITEAGDLYQAGAVLYFLLTGQPPYPRDSPAQVLAAQVSAPPPVPSALVPSASALDRVVTKAMAKESSRRYPDAYAFRDAIRGALASIRYSGDRHHQATRVISSAAPMWAPATPLGAMRAPSAASGATGTATGATTSASRPGPGLAPASAPVGVTERGSAVGLAVAGIAVVAVIAVATAIVGSHPAIAALSGGPTPTSPMPVSPSPDASPSASASTPVLVTVPTLYGTLADARDELRSSGLRLGRVTRVDAPDAAGHVLEQSPDAGLQVAWGTVVRVNVATGFNTVPSVADLGYDQAISVLKKAGLSCTDAAQAPGTISGSSPAGGTRVAVGTPITLVWAIATPASGEPTPQTASPSPSQPGG